MPDERTNSALAEFVSEGSIVKALVRRETTQVARRNAGDLRPKHGIMAPVGLHCTSRTAWEAVSTSAVAFGVSTARSIRVTMRRGPIEEHAVDSGVARSRQLLGAGALLRTPDAHYVAIERPVDRGELGDVLGIDPENVTDRGVVLRAVYDLPVGVVFLDPEPVDGDMNPAGEPARSGLRKS